MAEASLQELRRLWQDRRIQEISPIFHGENDTDLYHLAFGYD